jgi:hypothetical protein
MENVHRSDSAIQREAEPLILAGVSTIVGKELAPRTLCLESGAPVEVDGADANESVLVEIFAHQGPLKGGQKKKVSQDALKLITLRRNRPQAQLILAFADEQAAVYAKTGTWVSAALAAWDVRVIVVELDPTTRDGIRSAQLRQQMVNPPPLPAETTEAINAAIADIPSDHAFTDAAAEALTTDEPHHPQP